MAAVENPNRPASSSTSTKRSVRQTLGAGLVADLLLWKNKTVATSILVGATAFWILFDFAGYNVLSLVANSLLLLVCIIFFWAKSATLLNRPLPPIPNLEISNEAVDKAAEKVRLWINRVLCVARDIGVGRDRNAFLKVILVLWAVSYVGSFFSFFTVVYIGMILSFTVPALYDKYQDHVDEKLALVHNVLMKHCDDVLSRTGIQINKKKKAQ